MFGLTLDYIQQQGTVIHIHVHPAIPNRAPKPDCHWEAQRLGRHAMDAGGSDLNTSDHSPLYKPQSIPTQSNSDLNQKSNEHKGQDT